MELEEDFLLPWKHKKFIQFKSLLESQGSLIFENGILKIVSNRDTYDVTLPRIDNVDNKVNETKSLKGKMKRELYLARQELIYNPSKSAKDLCETIQNNILIIDEGMQMYARYIEEINYKKIGMQLDNIEREFRESNDHNNKLTLYKQMYQLQNTSKINYAIIRQPHIQETGNIPDSPPKPSRRKKTEGDEAPKKPKKKKEVEEKEIVVITPEQIDEIEFNVQELMKEVFKFRTVEECASRKSSQAFYMTKNEILSIIDSTPEIKNIVPDNYKRLTKEQLCQYLF